MKLQVNEQQRLAKMRAHTATHLLHYHLDLMLEGTKQSGSVVDEDLLRFDFAAREPLSDEQLLALEKEINNWIYLGSPISVVETDIESAKKTGAKAFFEDKYGATVRVVSVDGSVELCGGTHVENTSAIGAFKIVAQEAVASGIRRIVAVTGPEVARRFMILANEFTAASAIIDATPKQLPEKLQKLKKQLADTESAYESIKATQLLTTFSSLPTSSHDIFDYCINCSISLADYQFKDIITHAKQSLQEKNWLFFTQEGAFALHIASPTEQQSAKTIAKECNLRGGGNDSLVQGKDPAIVGLFS